MKKFYLFFTLTIIVMVLIFIFSSQRGEVSYSLSEKVSNTVRSKKVLTTFTPDTVAAVTVNIRKWAHIYLYFFLGINITLTISEIDEKRVFSSQKKKNLKSNIIIGIISISACLLYACTDEFHQYFIPGRTASIFDIRFDACGFIPGILIALLGSLIISKIRTLIYSHLIQIK